MSKLYIEAGGNDGAFQSRTMKYKDDLEWSGILVEPDPRCIDTCRQNRLNERTQVIQAALVPFDHKSPTVSLGRFSAAAMNTVSKHVFESRSSGQEDIIEVPAITLQAILDQSNRSVIDELYLDVEGYEAQVLEGIDPNKTTIKWAEIECHFHETDTAEQEVAIHVSKMAEFGLTLQDINREEGHPKLIFA